MLHIHQAACRLCIGRLFWRSVHGKTLFQEEDLALSLDSAPLLSWRSEAGVTGVACRGGGQFNKEELVNSGKATIGWGQKGNESKACPLSKSHAGGASEHILTLSLDTHLSNAEHVTQIGKKCLCLTRNSFIRDCCWLMGGKLLVTALCTHPSLYPALLVWLT